MPGSFEKNCLRAIPDQRAHVTDIPAALDSLYLLCTWTPAFSRISLIERFGFSKSFENLRIRADDSRCRQDHISLSVSVLRD
jgi:hypothetical protein